MKTVVQLNALAVRYADHFAVKGVDLSFEAGHIQALLGPNGSGKTTIFKAVLGAVAGEGTIRCQPESLRIGHLIEYPAFYSKLTVYENLQLFASYLDVNQARIAGLLRLVGLEQQQEKRFSNTSLGMRQRLGIARALLGDPHLLLLDEPTNGLDPLGARQFRELLLQIRDERGVAIVVASHNLSEVSAIADDITFLRQGRVVFQTSHTGPFDVDRANDDHYDIETASGRYRIRPQDNNTAVPHETLSLEDLYALLMEGEDK